MELKDLLKKIKFLKNVVKNPKSRRFQIAVAELRGIKQAVASMDNDLKDIEERINEKSILKLKVVWKPEWLEIKELLSSQLKPPLTKWFYN